MPGAAPHPAIPVNRFKRALREVLEEEALAGAEIAPRFANGTLILKPRDAAIQSKEVPMKDFFKKIVRLRDQLRQRQRLPVEGHREAADEADDDLLGSGRGSR